MSGYSKNRKWSREDIRAVLDTARFKKLAQSWLQRFPFCVRCLERGIRTNATLVDHKIPKRDTDQSYWYDERNFQSMCQHCHDTSKREEETKGYRNDIGFDGWPIDSKHPVNKPPKESPISSTATPSLRLVKDLPDGI